MKINKILFYILGCITILNGSCVYDDFDEKLKINNQSGTSIMIDDSLYPNPEYPSINHTEWFLSNVILNGEKKSIMQNNPNWPRYIRKSVNKKLNIFVYDLDTLKKYKDINYLIRQFKYKAIRLTEKELDSLNWQVEITPL